MTATATFLEVVTWEDWELARVALIELPQLEDSCALIEESFGVSLRDLEAILDLPPVSFEALRKRLIDAALAFLHARRDELRQKICVDLDYCELKKTSRWRIAGYIAAVVDITYTKGALSLAILALKQEVFDKLCGCGA